MLQGEATKYFRASINRNRKFSTFSYSFGGVLGGKMSKSMDYKVRTAECQSDGLQVLGIGEPWPLYLEEMEEYSILEPLVIKGMSHNANLGISFLMQHSLKIKCT